MDTMTKQKIETFLPCFPGFYETHYQYDDDNVLYCINQDRQNNGLSLIDYDSLEIDYQSYELDIVKNACHVIGNLLHEYVYSIEFQTIQRPKEYNFKNDSVNVIICPNIENIQKFIYNTKDQFQEFLKRRYTSCDGFISHYDNEFYSWEKDTKGFSDFSIDGHRLGSILEYIAYTLKIDKIEDIYFPLQDNIYQEGYILNYTECVNSPSCSLCGSLIKEDNSLSDIKKYKDILGHNPKTIHCQSCIDKNL